MRILITGSRDWTDRVAVYQTLYAYVTRHCPPDYDRHGNLIDYDLSDVTIVHGACPTGADVIAEDWAVVNWVVFERHPADWDKHGKAAGPIRNQEMVDLGADVCLAFPLPGSKGTRDCMAKARAAGIPVIEVEES